MRLYTAEEKAEAVAYPSEKIKGLEAMIFRNGTGLIQLEGKQFADLDIQKGHLGFDSIYISDQDIKLPSGLTLEQNIRFALDISELYARKELGAGYIEGKEPTPEEFQLPEHLKGKVEIEKKHMVSDAELNISDDFFALHMLDSDARINVYFKENGHDTTPRIHIRRQGDEEYYDARDLPPEKVREEEFGKAIEYMSHLPSSYLGERVSDWAVDVWNVSVRLIQDLTISNYLEPVEYETAVGSVTIQAMPYDPVYGATRPDEVKFYNTLGELKDTIVGCDNIYDIALDIVNVQELEKQRSKEEADLRKTFADKLYPNLMDLYDFDRCQLLPKETIALFNNFLEGHRRLYHFSPIDLERNECFKQLLEDKNYLLPYHDRIKSCISECNDYISRVNSGMSAEEALKYTQSGRVEDTIQRMQFLYKYCPEHLRPDFCTENELYDLSDKVLDTRYKDSKLLDNLANHFTKSEIKVLQASAFDPVRISSLLDLNLNGYEELYNRTDLGSLTGLPFDDFKHKGQMFAWLTTYFPDNAADLEVEAFISGDIYRRDVYISTSEQEKLNNELTVKLRMPVEEYLALKFADQPIIPSGGYDPIISEDGRSANFLLDLSDEQMEEVLNRCNVLEMVGASSFEDLKSYDCIVDAEVTMTANNLWMDLTSDVFEGPIPVPLGRYEKDKIRELSADVLDKPLKQNGEKERPSEIKKNQWNKRHPGMEMG